MSTPNQPHLNGAYYGPSIPPPTKTYHRPGRGGGGGCNPFTCCCKCLCSCLFTLLYQIFCTIVVTLVIAAFIFWLIFRPNAPKFHVTDASLTQFDLSTTNNTLYYNLALNITFRNPNKRIGIYYDRIESTAYYQKQRFAATELDPFYLGHKKENYLSPVLKGQQLVVLGGGDLSNYDSEKSSAVYSIDVKLYLRIRFKLGWAKTPKFKPKIECDLKVPLDSNGRASGTFESKKCHLAW